MATIKFHLKRGRKDPASLRTLFLRIRHRHDERQISLGIRLSPSIWDQKAQRVDPNSYQGKSLNARLSRMISEIEIRFALIETDRLGKYINISEYENSVCQYLFGRPSPQAIFIDRYLIFADRHQGRTRDVYHGTHRNLQRFDPHIHTRTFEEIDREYLIRYDQWLIENGGSPNYRGIHFRNIRAVFNDAIASEITTHYPFKRFKIPHSKTKKRSLSVEQLRTLLDFECEDCMKQYVDIFRLSFLLCGINMVDLFNLKDMHDGRISYMRSKTDRQFDIKVEPEALTIINRMRGEKNLVNIADRYKSHLNYISRINKNLKRIGPVVFGKHGKKEITPLFPELSTYWARHTWATIAAELDIPDKIISMALGHSEEQTVTDIYIHRNRKKVDDANRKVMDWVLYGMIDGKVVVNPWDPAFYGDYSALMNTTLK